MLAQLIALLVGFPLAQNSLGPERLVGVVALILALTGGILALTPQVGRAIALSDPPAD